MSFSPSLSVVRLQELKLWQGSYENLIQKSQGQTKRENGHLEEVPAVNNPSGSGSSSEGEKMNPKNWERKKIAPCKPFDQLLEEKLAEDTPKEGTSKPKKPFLRKGQGLARFKMGAVPPQSNRNKDFSLRRPVEVHKTSLTQVPQQKSTPVIKRGILKNSNPCYQQYVDYLTPLTVPDFVKPRGTWKSVFEKDVLCHKDVKKVDEEQEDVEDYEEFRMSLGYGENGTKRDGNSNKEEQGDLIFTKSSSKHTLDAKNDDVVSENKQSLSEHSLDNFNKNILEKINEYAQKYFQPYLSNDIPGEISDMSAPRFKNGAGDLTVYEQKMEQELKNFEELEKKVENSSFCSTNTSVANLLASTPRKGAIEERRNEIAQKKDNLPVFEIINNVEFTNDNHDYIQLKLLEVAEKTDVLQQFLMNLRKMDKGVRQGDLTLDSDVTKKSEKSTSTNTSFSEENTRWSTRSPSLADNYTEYDSTCQSDSWKKIDAGVNTSFDCTGLDETVKKWEPCKECEELRLKFSDTKIKLSDVRSENSNLKMDFKELKEKYNQTQKDMKKEMENYQEILESLQDELSQERKKLAKEKSYFENYVKDSQNRATKREREEITQLKQELADAKELLKLKESKNGATQARLRTQIKQQEKDITELKLTLEKLQRENAKLNASQKMFRHPKEVKMLHEINKNLSKLTEETFKNQMNKSGNNVIITEEKNIKEHPIQRKKSVIYEEGTKENDGNVIKKDIESISHGINSFKMDSAALDLTRSDDMTIEKRYEHVFGSFSSPRNSNISTNLEKNEETLPDGSMLVTYSNGNVKTISADGQVIVIKYFNGDMKETNITEQIIRYHYAATDSWHIQYADGTEVMEYKDGQKCTRYIDGKTEVTYPDGSIRTINPDGTEEQIFLDGRKTIKNLQGEQIIMLPNGQREIHTKEYKRREYPDGTIRTLRKDGSVETVYANGRIRLKDSNGLLVMDSIQSSKS